MKLFRREFLHLIAVVAAVPASRLAWAQEILQRVRVVTGLLATWHDRRGGSCLNEAGRVAHQAAGHDKFTPWVDRG
jgi:hypothetical protein